MKLVTKLLMTHTLFTNLNRRLTMTMNASIAFKRVLTFLLVNLVMPLILSLLTSTLAGVISVAKLNFVGHLLKTILKTVGCTLMVDLIVRFVSFTSSGSGLVRSAAGKDSLLCCPVGSFSTFFCPIIGAMARGFVRASGVRG